MTRAEAIAVIQRCLVEADDETICSVAEQLSAGLDNANAVDNENWLPRPLTSRELELIEQSKADFREGRTYTPEEAEAMIIQSLEERRRQRAKS